MDSEEQDGRLLMQTNVQCLIVIESYAILRPVNTLLFNLGLLTPLRFGLVTSFRS